MGKSGRKRPLAGGAGGGPGPPSHRASLAPPGPRTPGCGRGGGGGGAGTGRPRAGGGASAKRHQAAGGGPAHTAPASMHPALARPDAARWWPPPRDFEALSDPEDEDSEDDGGVDPAAPPGRASPPAVALPTPLTVAGMPLPPAGLASLASSAGPPGGPTAGRAVLEALIAPVSVETFLASVFEGRPLLVTGRGPAAAAAFGALFSSDDLRAWVDSGSACYGTALDIVRFDGRVRHTLNTNDAGDVGDAGDGGDGGGGGGGGRGARAGRAADPAVIARRLASEGCSARVLHPQRRSPPLAAVMCALEGFFGSLVGCNAYYTPAGGAQGFAPHADGVGVFILQAEGSKRWRVHGARVPGEVLPLVSSPDFGPAEVGPVVLDVVLEAGDLLYLPRGMVHQAETPVAARAVTKGGGQSQPPPPLPPSLHLTLSVSDGVRGGTWADLLGIALPRALELAAGRCVGLRRALPPGVVGGALGVAAEDSAARAAATGAAAAAADKSRGGGRPRPPYAARAAARAAATATLARAAAAVIAHLPLDAAADVLAADFISRRLPPPRPRTGDGDGPPPVVRPVAEGTAGRLVVEGGIAAVYHCMANDVATHAAGEEEEEEGDGAPCGRGCGHDHTAPDPGRLALPLAAAPAVEALLGVHSPRPGDPIRLADLVADLGGGEEAEEAVAMAAVAMWEAGLLEVG